MCVRLSRDRNGIGGSGSEMDVLNYFSGAGHGMPEASQPTVSDPTCSKEKMGQKSTLCA